jgi:hypothetical protein
VVAEIGELEAPLPPRDGPQPPVPGHRVHTTSNSANRWARLPGRNVLGAAQPATPSTPTDDARS